MGARGKLYLALAAGQRAAVRDVPLASGRWTLSVQGSGSPEVTLRQAGKVVHAVPGVALRWDSSGRHGVDISVDALPQQAATLQRLTFLRSIL
jgi:hypothetical protein